ncbi:MAG: DUF885 domain-containing protein [Bdellovibrionaceae bacterium]|nr:DUF885 domain-containing protein [Bdellovibrionales bacterium]MCB9084152.1 DUF885 domain-containing protein [Pseudobdellovibrionaceae bacterium]
MTFNLFRLPVMALVLSISLTSCFHSLKKEPTAADIERESARINKFFEDYFDAVLDRSPEFQTYLGIKKNYDKLGDYSDEFARKELEYTKEALKKLKTFDYAALNEQAQTSYRLFEEMAQDEIDKFKWRFHSYPFNQMFGYHSQMPAFLMNFHRVSDESDAVAYIKRIESLPRQLGQVLDGMKIREQKKIFPPQFAFSKVSEDTENLLKGYPLTDDEKSPHPLYEDFARKLGGIKDLKAERKQQLQERMAKALKEKFKPAYQNFLTYWKALEPKAAKNHGVWSLPEGEEFYRFSLKRTTTTDMTADQIHQLGLDEVARIHGEMRAIMKKVKFKGDLQAFFKHLKEDPKFYLPGGEKGREQYMTSAKRSIASMKDKLPGLFTVKPKAELIVKPVETYREKSAGLAFYEGPSLDGTRPGTYYVNLYDMKGLPTYEIEALAFHEGIPGHHMQIAIATELENLPRFRKFGHYTAYAEGWGLYAEYIPKELGFYTDPYSDFGRLSMELWRACRLVLDTGLHAKKWTREQGIEYLLVNTPSDEREATKAIERYLVMPSQATAYKVGMLKIMELRRKSQQSLGEKFDIRGFHDEILRHGPLPMNILEEKITAWVESKKGV